MKIYNQKLRNQKTKKMTVINVFTENILMIITLLELIIMVMTVFLVENKIKNL